MQLDDLNHTNFTSCNLNHVDIRDSSVSDQFISNSSHMVSQVDNANYGSNEVPATDIELRCPVCQLLFNSYDQMSRHLNIHNTGKPYVCSHCNASFNQAENLYVHISLYHTLGVNKSNYNCCLCDKRFLRFSAYKSHLLLHQIDENFVCFTCEQPFESITLYEKHLRTCTLDTRDTKSPSQYRCHVCGMLLSSVGKIKQHYLRRHRVDQLQSGRNSVLNIAPNPESSVDMDLGNVRKSKLRAADYLSTMIKNDRRKGRNSFSVLDQLIYEIPSDQPINQDYSNITNSKHKKRKISYSCLLCHKKFLKPSLLRRHITIHTKHKSYECALCHAKFTQKSSAKTHLLLHMSSVNPRTTYHSTKHNLEPPLTLCSDESTPQKNTTIKMPEVNPNMTLPVNGSINILTLPPHNATSVNTSTPPQSSVVLQLFIPQYQASEVTAHEVGTSQTAYDRTPPILDQNHEKHCSYPKVLSCPVCFRVFKLSKSLAIHMLRHPMVSSRKYRGNNSKNCVQQKCVQSKLSVKSYNKCKRLCSRKLLHRFNRCIHCFKSFRSVNRLKMHIYKTHQGRCTIFECNKCPRRFMSSLGLKRHINLLHRCVKNNNICAICQALFYSSSALKRHMDTHSNERLFSCYICHKRFQFLHSCRRHTRNHSTFERNKDELRSLSGCFTTNLPTSHRNPVLQNLHKNNSTESKNMGSCLEPYTIIGEFMNPVDKCSFYNNTGSNTLEPDNLSVIVQIESPSNNSRSNFVSLSKSTAGCRTFDMTTVDSFNHSLTNFTNLPNSGVVVEHPNDFSEQQICIWNGFSNENVSLNKINEPVDMFVIDPSQAFNAIDVPIESSLDTYQQPVLFASNIVDHSEFTQNFIVDSSFNTQSVIFNTEPLENNQTTTNSRYASNAITSNPDQVNIVSPIDKAIPLSETCSDSHKSRVSGKGVSNVVHSSIPTVLPTQHLKLYGCGLCSVVYEDSEKLLHHNRISHNNTLKSFTCSTCSRSFVNPTLLLSHSRTHTPEYNGVLNCPLCPTSIFSKQSALSRHIIYCHPLPNSEPFQCARCGMRFMMMRSLKSHVNNILNGVDVCISKLPTAEQGTGSDDKNSHISTNILTSSKINTHRVSSLSSNLVDEIAKLQPSDNLSLSEKYLIKAARERVENTVSFPKQKTTYSLNQQLTSIINENICSICNRKFTRKSDLRYHVNVHNGIRPYECDKCHRRFMKHCELRQHKFKVHEMTNLNKTTKNKTLRIKQTLICHLCSSRFSSRSSLRLHVRLHTGTRGYGCLYCNSVFHNPSHRKRHLIQCQMKLRPIVNLSHSPNLRLYSQQLANTNQVSCQPENENNILTETTSETVRIDNSFRQCICDDSNREQCNKCTIYLDILVYTDDMPSNITKVVNNVFEDNITQCINTSSCELESISAVYFNPTNSNHSGIVEEQLINQNIPSSFNSILDDQTCQDLLNPIPGTSELNQQVTPVNNEVTNIITNHDNNNNDCNANQLVLCSTDNIFDYVPCKDIFPVEIELRKQTNDLMPNTSIPRNSSNHISVMNPIKSVTLKSKSTVNYLSNKNFQRLFKCSTCKKTFTKNSSLLRHERTHKRLKPFVCRFCGVGFTQSFSLTSHELIHTGGKPYQCTQCSARFRQSCNLKRHVKLVHK
ncbi:unnamed protein product [Heterobilharzia americana]|nr:unnamed protein product [Heterobilharzia americana]